MQSCEEFGELASLLQPAGKTPYRFYSPDHKLFKLLRSEHYVGSRMPLTRVAQILAEALPWEISVLLGALMRNPGVFPLANS